MTQHALCAWCTPFTGEFDRPRVCVDGLTITGYKSIRSMYLQCLLVIPSNFLPLYNVHHLRATPLRAYLCVTNEGTERGRERGGV